MVITFSGCDGVGKSTHANMLLEYLTEGNEKKGVDLAVFLNNNLVYNAVEELDDIFLELQKYDVIVSRFYLKSKRYHQLQNKLRFYNGKDAFSQKQFIMEVAKAAKEEAVLWYEHVVKKLLAQGKHIIFDRFFYDEMAYRSLYGIEMKAIEEMYQDFYKPDLSFLIKIDLDAILKRNADREDSQTTLFGNIEKLNELNCNFDKVAETYGITIINGTNREIEEVSKEIRNYLNKCGEK